MRQSQIYHIGGHKRGVNKFEKADEKKIEKKILIIGMKEKISYILQAL